MALLLERNATPRLFAADWGTTSCRLWALDENGETLASARSDDGMLDVSKRAEPDTAEGRAAAFAAALRSIGGEALREHPDVPIIACGMVGSEHGWVEAPYAEVPADLARHGTALVRVPFEATSVWIVPGIAQDGRPDHGFPDVMRGEETQIIGALGMLRPADGVHVLVLPGTHTKWVEVIDGIVTRFETSMSGELYGAVMGATILGRPAIDVDGFDRTAFLRGVAMARAQLNAGGLAATLFSARTLYMRGSLPATSIGDYVSGVLIGDETAHMLDAFATAAAPIAVCGDDAMTSRYAQAVATAGLTTIRLDERATLAGLWRIALDAGLVDAPHGTDHSNHPAGTDAQNGAHDARRANGTEGGQDA